MLLQSIVGTSSYSSFKVYFFPKSNDVGYNKKTVVVILFIIPIGYNRWSYMKFYSLQSYEMLHLLVWFYRTRILQHQNIRYNFKFYKKHKKQIKNSFVISNILKHGNNLVRPCDIYPLHFVWEKAVTMTANITFYYGRKRTITHKRRLF